MHPTHKVGFYLPCRMFKIIYFLNISDTQLGTLRDQVDLLLRCLGVFPS